jgi:hypothetical protein
MTTVPVTNSTNVPVAKRDADPASTEGTTT